MPSEETRRKISAARETPERLAARENFLFLARGYALESENTKYPSPKSFLILHPQHDSQMVPKV